MTLIITHISKHGIIHASDSNLSDQEGKTIGTGKKCFLIPQLNSGLTVAGSFSVGQKRMDDWMKQFIADSKATELKTFAEDLRSTLQSEMTKEQKSAGSLIHIAGYKKTNGKSHPEFWFVRNIHNLDIDTGEYTDFKEEFIISEDFWTRDNKSDLFKEFQSDNSMYQLYINGFSPGRIGYNIVQGYLNQFFSGLWSQKNWKFRPPQDIEEAKELIVNYMRIINTIFKLSDYPGQLIGGTTQIVKIPQPASIE